MTMMIAVPTGTKIYNYMVTMHRYTDHMITAKSVIMILLLTVFVSFSLQLLCPSGQLVDRAFRKPSIILLGRGMGAGGSRAEGKW